jgi:DNA-binding MarR family transcriptional regulator
MALSLTDAAAQFTFAVHEELTRVAATQQLSVTQLRVLGILRDRTPSMADIADRLGLDRSSVTGLIDRAAARGLVERAPSPHDARVVTVRLTNAGRAVGAELERDAESRITHLLRNVPAEERAALVRTVPLLRRS